MEERAYAKGLNQTPRGQGKDAVMCCCPGQSCARGCTAMRKRNAFGFLPHSLLKFLNRQFMPQKWHSLRRRGQTQVGKQGRQVSEMGIKVPRALRVLR